MTRSHVARRSSAAVACAAVLVLGWAMFMSAATAQSTDEPRATLGQILATAEAQDGVEGFDSTEFKEALDEYIAHQGLPPLNADDTVSRDAMNYALGKATGVDVEVDGGLQNWKNMRDSCMSFGYSQVEDDFRGEQATAVEQLVVYGCDADPGPPDPPAHPWSGQTFSAAC